MTLLKIVFFAVVAVAIVVEDVFGAAKLPAPVFDERDLHPSAQTVTANRFGEISKLGDKEKSTRFWHANAQRTVKEKLLHPSINTEKDTHLSMRHLQIAVADLRKKAAHIAKLTGSKQQFKPAKRPLSGRNKPRKTGRITQHQNKNRRPVYCPDSMITINKH